MHKSPRAGAEPSEFAGQAIRGGFSDLEDSLTYRHAFADHALACSRCDRGFAA